MDGIDVSQVEGLQRSLFVNGNVRDYAFGVQGVIVKGTLHGNCQNPIEITREAWTTGPSGQTKLDAVNGSAGKLRRTVTVSLRCRKCTSCLQARATYWRNAATMEMAQASLGGGRSWFGTLTLSAEEQSFALYRAFTRLGGSNTFWDLSPERQFAERHASVSGPLTLALKRLRKAMRGGTFRYLLVCEAHKSGLPHYHMLLHEIAADQPIRKSLLNDFWPLGFSQFRLAKPEAARYVAKYLSKDASARVRASRLYGSRIHIPLSERPSNEGATTMPHNDDAATKEPLSRSD